MASLICASKALAADSAVVIGNLDDLSGVYSADGGPGAVEGMRMAIADFGGGVLGREVRTLVADHQNKPDIGASKFREWADPKGLSMMLVGANTASASPCPRWRGEEDTALHSSAQSGRRARRLSGR
jgi:branched-chain amino acid transport system substrate-binding protein